jgi:hypothetical protein
VPNDRVPPRCRRSSSEPPLATTRLLHRRAPSSRPASVTSTSPHRVGKPPTVKPCPTGRPCVASALRVNTAPPSLPPRQRWLRRRGRAGHGDCAHRAHARYGWQAGHATPGRPLPGLRLPLGPGWAGQGRASHGLPHEAGHLAADGPHVVG